MKLFLAFILAFFSSVISHAQITGGGNKIFTQEYVYDFAKLGGAVGFIGLKGAGANALPSGAVILSAHYQVLAALTSGGTATVALGDAASGAKYLAATAFNNAAYTLNLPAIVAIGVPGLVSSSNIASPGITVAGAALTGGKLRIVFQGYIPKGE